MWYQHILLTRKQHTRNGKSQKTENKLLHMQGAAMLSCNKKWRVCSSCDKILTETSDENPIVPHHAKYPNVVTGANFLKALNQRPEYVCTCYHHMLFHKIVQQFHMEDYDISNETVKECLPHWYVMKCTDTHLMKMMTWHHINGHNLCQMISNMMIYMSCMNIFVYAAETA